MHEQQQRMTVLIFTDNCVAIELYHPWFDGVYRSSINGLSRNTGKQAIRAYATTRACDSLTRQRTNTELYSHGTCDV
jgi:hypothetical protein